MITNLAEALKELLVTKQQLTEALKQNYDYIKICQNYRSTLTSMSAYVDDLEHDIAEKEAANGTLVARLTESFKKLGLRDKEAFWEAHSIVYGAKEEVK